MIPRCVDHILLGTLYEFLIIIHQRKDLQKVNKYYIQTGFVKWMRNTTKLYRYLSLIIKQLSHSFSYSSKAPLIKHYSGW